MELSRRLAALGYIDHVDEPAAPRKTGVRRWRRGRTGDGYSLYVVRPTCTAVLIAMDGTVVRTWRSERRGCAGWSNAELLPDGELVVPEIGFGLRRYEFGGRPLGFLRMLVHHDVEQTPDGRLATLTHDFRIIPEAHPTIKTGNDNITTLSKSGRVIEHASLWDLFARHPLGAQLNKGEPRKNVYDLFHANSVEWMHRTDLAAKDPLYALDNVLVSVRNQNVVVIVSWNRQEIVWAWGRGHLSEQHDASVLPNGHILIFDNGVGRNRSRLVEVDPLRSKVVWSYDGSPDKTFYTRRRGSAQRLPNGNTLFAVSDRGYAREVTADGQIVWEYFSPHLVDGKRATLIRIKRYPASMIEPLLAVGPG
jgi:hypothetical protein